ncbi:TPA: pilus assembly protein PilW [Vibrio parahaemolyticus]|uniref:PilW family protein n=1 Tax=Vibrio parahaemolyticus TaxID=670 RepID=UPI001122122D|nr:pilus assembly protein PilW [Vibrio parahaemolyticus]EGQ7919412.1 pilus assembly protein PilW [Vibrio parahaemolyticus]EGQ9941492.1 pilus assembly protein PilW [Vibrio parahaemolyticus]EHH3647608.1 pilus assembly protein PilW [Vibrio parahaemolyticus]EHH3736361.1 pilus assembly protein PilW [Vibrio parahaemolyticus]EHR1108847.1 pilus assembly protein PilW [Vibrio parahaemolyticus]
MFKQKGASLVEFMIASALGLISLATVGSIYVSGQRVIMERSKELMLLQNSESVVQMLKSDIQRAGFDGNDGHSIKISGSANTIYTLDDVDRGLIAYAYYIGVSGSAPLYKNVAYEQRVNTPDSLFVCEKKQITIWDVNDVVNLAGTGSCNTLFDKKVIHVNRFDLASELLESTDAKSALVTITLGTELKDATDIRTQQSFTAMQRNWQ